MEKKARFLINALYFSLVFLIGYFVLKYAFNWLLPFVFGFLFALIVRGISNRLFKNTHINNRVGCITVVLLIYAVLLALAAVFGAGLFEEAQEHLSSLPKTYEKTILPAFDMLSEWSTKVVEGLAPNAGVYSSQLLNAFKENTGSMIVSISGKAVDFLAGLIKEIPSVFMFLFFSMISSLLIIWDYEKIITFFSKQISKKTKDIIIKVKHVFFDSVLKLLKAYFILMLITFAELLVGFLILKVEQPVVKAIVISFADFLPFIGVSFVLVPWVVFALLQKDFYTAIGLSVLLLIITIIRNFLEPKIIGRQIGLNPIVSLICFYVGMKLFGFWGIIILPLVVILLKSFNDEGILKLWK